MYLFDWRVFVVADEVMAARGAEMLRALLPCGPYMSRAGRDFVGDRVRAQAKAAAEGRSLGWSDAQYERVIRLYRTFVARGA